jgi:hypothetical protein
MVDPVTTAALAATIAPLVSGAAGEAGKQAWQSLTSFVRGRWGREATVTVDAEALAADPADAACQTRLVEGLYRLTQDDGEAAQWVRTWLHDSAALVDQHQAVVNVISGEARVHGPVVQAHTISGSVTFGATPAPAADESR